MNFEDIKQNIRNNIKFETRPLGIKGGQTCGVMPKKVALISEELDLEIMVGYYRSQFQNKELSLVLFELAMDDLIK